MEVIAPICFTEMSISALWKMSSLVCRMLAKQVQTELAQANSVADEALATMTTVRAHAADDSARAAYAVKLAKFYVLQVCAFVPCLGPWVNATATGCRFATIMRGTDKG